MTPESTKDNKNLDNHNRIKAEDVYHDGYLKWKNWDEQQFGLLTKDDETYFTAELRKCNHTFPEKSSVLEVGFGNGSFLRYAQNNKWNIIGVEANEHLIRTANEHHFSAVHASSITEFDNDSFDLIVAFDVLEHIGNEEILDYLCEIKRILKPNGFFLARFPNGDSPFGLINQNGDYTHVNFIGSGKSKFLARSLSVKLVYLGKESEPYLTGPQIHLLSRAFSIIAKKAINKLINIIFFPNSNIAFCSFNLIFIFKKV